MLPGTPTPDQPDPADHSEPAERRMFFAEARSLLGDGADTEQVMRVAEWLHTGGPVLDPTRVCDAARALAAQEVSYGGSRDYDFMGPGERAVFEGRAAQVVLGYLQGPR